MRVQPQSKMMQVAREFNIPLGNQGTTGNIFQDVPIDPAGQQVFEFFSTLNLTPEPRKNIAQNRFQSGEAMAIKSIAFTLVSGTERFYSPFELGNARVTMKIGETEVLSRFYVAPRGNGAGAKYMNWTIFLENFIVIPALQDFSIRLTTQRPLTDTVADWMGVDLFGISVLPSGVY